MVYDTKVYTTIYNNITLTFLKKDNVDVSTKIARTDMAHDIVHVLESYAHYYMATIITIIGSLIFIYSENWKVGVLVSIATFFIVGAVFILYKKIKQVITIRNDHYEKKAKSIENGYLSTESFFLRRRRIEIYDSTIQGKSWFLANSVKYVFLLFSIVLLVTTTKNITIGSIITVYSYVNNFLISLMSAPVIVEMCLRTTDILKRIE
jgi:ABC-type multidrug transport system fused ATPase/permease subunit